MPGSKCVIHLRDEFTYKSRTADWANGWDAWKLHSEVSQSVDLGADLVPRPTAKSAILQGFTFWTNGCFSHGYKWTIVYDGVWRRGSKSKHASIVGKEKQ